MSGLVADRQEAGKNIVITLNYDLLVEQVLRTFGIPIAYGLDGKKAEVHSTAGVDESRRDALQVLKLHGSVNWARRANDSIVVCRDYEEVRSLNLSPLLVPPAWHKIPSVALVSVWDAAVRAIAAATRITVIGFSISPTDQHFKYLLAVGLKNNSSLRAIKIGDPRAVELRGQYQAVFREDQFNYGIVTTRAMRSAEFFYDQKEMESLGRPIAHPGLDIVADDEKGLKIFRS